MTFRQIVGEPAKQQLPYIVYILVPRTWGKGLCRCSLSEGS